MDLRQRLKRKINLEAALASITAVLCVVTLISREWIEALTGWDPDHGNGAVEWIIVAILLLATAAFAALARTDWRKLQALPA